MGSRLGQRHFSLSVALALFAVVALSSNCFGQAPPRSISDLVTKTRLSTEETTRIENYTSFHWQRLTEAEADIEKAEASRDALLQPVKGNAASAVFREQYRRSLLPGIRNFLEKDGDLYCAVNSMYLLGQIATKDTLNELCRQTNEDRQDRWQIRLAAARSAAHLLNGKRLANSKAAVFAGAARSLKRSAMNETNPMVMRHIFRAMFMTDQPVLGGPTRLEIYSSISAAANRIAIEDFDQKVELIEATDEALTATLDTILGLKGPNSDLLGPAMASIFVCVLDGYRSVDRDIATGSVRRDSLGSAIQRVQTRLNTVANVTWPGSSLPSSAFAEAWKAGDSSRFDTMVQAWKSKLSD